MKKSPVICAGFLKFLALQVTGGRAPRYYLQLKEKRPQTSLPAFKTDPDFGKMPVYFIPNQGQM